MRVSELIEAMASSGKSIAVAESLTGGALLSELISIPGASNVVQGGIVCYSTESKTQVLGVPAEIIEQYGAVSAETAIEMASQVAQKFSANIGIATTGVAGPDAQEGKPVGQVYLAIAGISGSEVLSLNLTGNRDQIRHGTVSAGIALLGKYSGT